MVLGMSSLKNVDILVLFFLIRLYHQLIFIGKVVNGLSNKIKIGRISLPKLSSL